ncbi:MAG: glycosyltransferase family 9 protein [Acidobacteriota bacterium]
MKILLIRLSAIGDVVRTLPALSCLRRAYPTAHIDWAVEEPSTELVADQADLDGILVFPRRRLSRVLLHPGELPSAWAHLVDFTRSLKEARYDLVIDFQGTLKSGLIAWMTRAPRRAGLGPGHARELSYLFYNDRLRLPRRKKMNRVERALALVRHLGVATEGAAARIPEKPGDAAHVEAFLSSLPAAEGGPAAPAVIFPGTSRTQQYKRYPAGHFTRVADLMAERAGVPVVIAWGPGEEELAGQVLRSMHRSATLAPSLTLGQLTALIRRSSVFVAGDTGPMHIAWTVGTPLVAVYGPTDPVLNRPGGRFSTVAYSKVHCSPCRTRGCIARTCLERLAPETVAEAAIGVMHAALADAPASRRTERKQGPVGGIRHETMGPGTRAGQYQP